MGRRKENAVNKFIKENHTRLVSFVLIIFGITGLFFSDGIVTHAVKASVYYLFGSYYFIVLIGVLVYGLYLLFKNKHPKLYSMRLLGIYLIFIGVLVISCLSIYKNLPKDLSIAINVITNTTKDIITNKSVNLFTGSGVISVFITSGLVALFSNLGAFIISIIFIVSGISIVTGFSILEYCKTHFKFDKKRKEENKQIIENTIEIEEPKVKLTDRLFKYEDKEEIKKEYIKTKEELDTYNIKQERAEIVDKLISEDMVLEEENESVINNTKDLILPPISLLSKSNNKNRDKDRYKHIAKVSETLISTLEEYDIKCAVVDTHIGPAVTQYELTAMKGIKLSKIIGLDKELSLALGVKSIKIEAPIPGKRTIGIEVANDSIDAVNLRDILESKSEKDKNKKLLVALGKDIMGQSKFCEINKTPHLLVAGSTGSGKSVCINSIIISLIMNCRPDELRLVMVDPKKVELSIYNGLPHLLCPVVTDPQRASIALLKLVDEMEKRFITFEKSHTKNIESYNAVASEKIPYIVCIIDELADLMMVAAKEVQSSIMRITQMARAAGIHLIVATQRPSTDIITGVVKSNIPTRISFAVSSGIDSRTILDCTGAEKLLGRGDMLYKPIDDNNPVRIQGAFVSDQEIAKIVKYVIDQQIQSSVNKEFMDLNAPTLNTKVQEERGILDTREDKDEEFYEEVLDFAIKTGKISASLVQRRFGVGFNKAARIIDLLEERNVVGPNNGSKPRQVLISKNEEE